MILAENLVKFYDEKSKDPHPDFLIVLAFQTTCKIHTKWRSSQAPICYATSFNELTSFFSMKVQFGENINMEHANINK